MRSAFLFLLIILFAPVSHAAAQTPYYQGKTITIITGSQTGDVFDIYARMIAAHMGKHISGNPRRPTKRRKPRGWAEASSCSKKIRAPAARLRGLSAR